jgi:predicted RNase H-like HicB family nuclease
MASGPTGDTDAFVIDGFTVVSKRQADGTYTSEVIDLPGCTGSAGSPEELVEATRRAVRSFLKQ